jgi:hypothetical protein
MIHDSTWKYYIAISSPSVLPRHPPSLGYMGIPGNPNHGLVDILIIT